MGKACTELKLPHYYCTVLSSADNITTVLSSCRYLTQGVPVVLCTSLVPLCLLLGPCLMPSASVGGLMLLGGWVVLAHSLLAHKEFRFIMPVLPLASVLSGEIGTTTCVKIYIYVPHVMAHEIVELYMYIPVCVIKCAWPLVTYYDSEGILWNRSCSEPDVLIQKMQRYVEWRINNMATEEFVMYTEIILGSIYWNIVSVRKQSIIKLPNQCGAGVAVLSCWWMSQWLCGSA